MVIKDRKYFYYNTASCLIYSFCILFPEPKIGHCRIFGRREGHFPVCFINHPIDTSLYPYVSKNIAYWKTFISFFRSHPRNWSLSNKNCTQAQIDGVKTKSTLQVRIFFCILKQTILYILGKFVHFWDIFENYKNFKFCIKLFENGVLR